MSVMHISAVSPPPGGTSTTTLLKETQNDEKPMIGEITENSIANGIPTKRSIVQEQHRDIVQHITST
jgi:hypothetical protein